MIQHSSLRTQHSGLRTQHSALKASGFTLIELTVAAGLMTIIMVMLYTIFSSAGNIFSGADSRIEIFQTARAVIDTMNRDFQGCVVDQYGNVFLGWNRAAYTSTSYSPTIAGLLSPNGQRVSNVDVPLPTTAFLNLLQDSGYISLLPYCTPDMVWFRTTTESSNLGVPTEVVYRLRCDHSATTGQVNVLEKGVSRTLVQGPVTSTTLATFLADTTRFQFTPVGFHVREFQLRYLRVDQNNVSMDTRAPSQGSWQSPWFDFWPPPYAVYGGYSVSDVDPAAYTATPGTTYPFDSISAHRARIPAAVEVTLRIGDSNDHEWTDYYSSYIVDGRDEPLPYSSSRWLGPAKSPTDPTDGMKQADGNADEVGMVFRQVMFIPTYINALGPRRGDL